MKLEVVSSRTQPTLKASIHRSGEITFNPATMEALGAKVGSYALLMVDKDEKNPLVFYMEVLPKEHIDAYRFSSPGGKSIYLNGISFLDKIGIPYKERTIKYHLERIKHFNKIYWKFNPDEATNKKGLKKEN